MNMLRSAGGRTPHSGCPHEEPLPGPQLAVRCSQVDMVDRRADAWSAVWHVEPQRLQPQELYAEVPRTHFDILHLRKAGQPEQGRWTRIRGADLSSLPNAPGTLVSMHGVPGSAQVVVSYQGGQSGGTIQVCPILSPVSA